MIFVATREQITSRTNPGRRTHDCRRDVSDVFPTINQAIDTHHFYPTVSVSVRFLKLIVSAQRPAEIGFSIL